MATIRALLVALVLAFCFASCASAPAGKGREPTNRYISYAALRHSRGESDHNPRRPVACSVKTNRCVGSLAARLHGPPKAGATTAAAAVSQSQGLAALPADKQAIPTEAGTKPRATGSKDRYISHAALSADKLCGRFGCPNRHA